MAKAHIPTHNSNERIENTNTSITKRLRTDLRRTSLNNDSHPTVVVKPVNWIPSSHSPQKMCNQKNAHFKNCKSSSL